MDNNLISVIVPVYNGEAFVTDAITSILRQDYQPLELLVVDDGSTDHSAALIKDLDPAVQVIGQDNMGTSVARNRGVAASRGDWLAFLDADDLWTPGKLVRQASLLEEDPSLDVVWGHVQEFSGAVPPDPDPSRATPAQHPGTMLIRRTAFDRVGGFSEKFQGSEVLEWMTRVLHGGLKSLILPEVMMFRRIHACNKGKVGGYSKHEYLHVLKRHLDRKRSVNQAVAG